MRVAIIGAGFTGLTAAYYLARNGHQVTIMEKNSFAGGLAAGFQRKDWRWPVEYYPHHLFTSDKMIRRLIGELRLGRKMFFLAPKTSIFAEGKISRFDSPLAVLKSPQFFLAEKIRLGAVTTYLKLTNNWQELDKVTAHRWLSSYYGQKIYARLWEPLLKEKFSKNYYQKISMAWFWARIKKRSRHLGYIEGGFSTVVDHLVKKIKESGGKILLNTPIKDLNDIYHLGEFDRIIFTTPMAAFLSIVGSRLPKKYWERYQKLKMLGTVNLILILKEQFLTDNTYWLNINESDFPFVAIIEHTNFIDPKYYGGQHLVYVGGYYPQNHRYFLMSKEEILQEFRPYLKKINPGFNFKSSILNFQLRANKFTQPITPVGYAKIIPPHQTPIPGVYLANMEQVYPWDRGTNYAVDLGEKISRLITC